MATVFAHIALLLHLKPVNNVEMSLLFITIVFIILVGIMLILPITDNFGRIDEYYRFLGVFGILDVLGTIITPVVNTIVAKPETRKTDYPSGKDMAS
ncbi:hypothetical protein [Sinomicrobium oceani]|nr:hypothetical protein [Sinomicrobium oceani]